jgi:hypothetical protein
MTSGAQKINPWRFTSLPNSVPPSYTSAQGRRMLVRKAPQRSKSRPIVARASRLRVAAPSRCRCAYAIFRPSSRGETAPILAVETAALHFDSSPQHPAASVECSAHSQNPTFHPHCNILSNNRLHKPSGSIRLNPAKNFSNPSCLPHSTFLLKPRTHKCVTSLICKD